MTDVAEQAAALVVRLTGDDPDDRARAQREFERWKQADPRHAATAARMEGLVGRLAELQPRSDAARSVLSAAAVQRRRNRRGAALGSVLMLAVTLAFLAGRPQPLPVTAWFADIRTGAGQQQAHVLADGSRLLLGGSSAVDIEFDPASRTIELLRGSVLVDVAPDVTRPFTVRTSHGMVRALGTRFAVIRAAEWTRLDMLESRVDVRSARATETREIEPGLSVDIHPDHIGATRPIDTRAVEEAWRKHQLVIDDLSLAETLEELARHRRGAILFDRDELEGLRVSAVLPLGDPDRALDLLSKSFPELRVGRLTPWVVTVERVVSE